MARLSENAPVEMRVAREMREVVEPTTHFARVAAYVDDLITPTAPAVAYGPRQKRYRAPLTDHRHFGTVAQISARDDALARGNLTPCMQRVQRLWSAVYTGALYARSPRQLKALFEDVVALQYAVIAAGHEINDALRELRKPTKNPPRVTAPPAGTPTQAPGAKRTDAKRRRNAHPSGGKVRAAVE